MADRLPAFLDLARHGITPDDVVRTYLGCSPTDIHRKAIILPVWNADLFRPHVDSVTPVHVGHTWAVWTLDYAGQHFSLIRSGMTAAFAGDLVLALGCTPCETLLFSGSVGGLLPTMNVGDFIVPERAVCGEGFSRYLEPEVTPRDCVLDAALPDAALTARLHGVTERAAREHAVPLYSGAVICVDSIVAQFFRLSYFTENHACIGVEMETSATFKAAALVGIRAAALLQTSDVIPTRKSLFSGRTEEEMTHRAHIKTDILPRLLLDTLAAGVAEGKA